MKNTGCRYRTPVLAALLGLGWAVVCLAGAGAAFAQSVEGEAGGGIVRLTLQAPAPPPPDANGILAGELERWVEGWLKKHLTAPGGAPGMVVAVVQRDRVLLAQGYGVADLATRSPTTADTVFRVGSLSKPVTATAIMQLVEAGRIDLRAPVNEYLHGIKLPFSGRDVTLLDLATHTAGFDVRLVGTAAPSDLEVQPLGTYLRANLPPQVRPPGQLLSYSNHAYALLGHVVEEVTGRSFERYSAENVFAPLGMTRSSFRFSHALQTLAATGYERSGSTFRPAVVIHPRIYPAAGLNTTARDMGAFMIAMLNGGRLGEGRVLAEASVAEMQRQQFVQSRSMPGVTVGFFENFTRGERALVHAGGIRGFMSGLCLWPRQRLGLFVSNNGSSGALVQSFLADFVRHYFHGPLAQGRARNSGTDWRDARRALELERFEGAYRAVGATKGSLEKAGGLLSGDVQIEAAAGYRPHLNFGGDWFVPTGGLDFVSDRGEEPLAFREDERGEVRLLVTTSPLIGCEVFEKVPWYKTARLHRELLVLFCASFLSVLLAPLVRRVAPLVPQVASLIPQLDTWQSGRHPPSASSKVGGRLRAALFLVAGLDVLFVVLLVAAFRRASDTGLLFGIPPLVRLDLMLASGAAGLALTLPFCAWRAWRKGYWSRAARIHYTWCTLAAVAFVPFLRFWNLLGY